MMILLFLFLEFLSAGKPVSFDEIKDSYRKSDVFLLARDGTPIQEIRVDEQNRTLEWSSLEDVSPAFVRTIVATEDKRFFYHPGIDPIATLSVIKDYGFKHKLRGASTISMQLANLLENPVRKNRTFSSKIRQVVKALQLELFWKKAEILEAYLNLVSFRGELRGIHAAARGIFDKAPSGLSDVESSILTALVRNPNGSPLRVKQNACAILMRSKSAMSCEDVEKYVEIAFAKSFIIHNKISFAPHAARFLIKPSPTGRKRENFQSTIDANLQAKVTAILSERIADLNSQNVNDGAALVVDNASGEVLAYVGNANPDSSQMYVDGAQAHRQAGSTLKPFIYGLAFDRRILTPASLMDDSPLELSMTRGVYSPENYDKQFHGLVEARTALASSLNIPAIRAMLLVGGDSFLQLLTALGFKVTEEFSFYGPSLALGSIDASLWEITSAYRMLANKGVYSDISLVPRSGLPIPSRRILSEGSAYLISDILSSRLARSMTFGFDSTLATRFWSAAKTGTSKDMRDNWCFGYSEKFTVGVWVGNFKGDSMWDVSGVSGAAPAWAEIMDYLHKNLGSDPPSAPADEVVEANYKTPLSNNLATGFFLAGTEPEIVSTHHGKETPEIFYPPDGTIIALDPDIPRKQQRILFEARNPRSGIRWILDGKDQGPANQSVAWQLEAGRHTIALQEPDGPIVSKSGFFVRAF